jgi:O-antigen/teichoic acid export membrane protein
MNYANTRTKLANINTLLSFIFKGLSIVLSFLLVPMTIKYIKPDLYGVWLTMTSLIGWITMFDIGLSNGLKNKLSESLAVNKQDLAKTLVSTTYFIIFIFTFVLYLIFLVIHQFVDWQDVFNAHFVNSTKLKNTVHLVMLFFLLKFVTDIINVVSAAYQMVALGALILLLNNLGLTIAVWILIKTTTPDFLTFASVLSIVPFCITLIISILIFKMKFSSVIPSYRAINIKKTKGIFNLGVQFFILQIVFVVVFQTDNFLISYFFSPAEVTNFNIAYKYHSILAIIFSILLAPYWTAFNEAFYKGDLVWIKNAVNRQIIYFLLSVVVSVLMVLIAPIVFRIWIGENLRISVQISIALATYIGIMNWNAIFSNFLNGIGKIKLQMMFAPVVALLNILLSIFLIKVIKLNVVAIPIANVISLSLGAVLGFIQYKKIINEKAKGVWIK